VSSPEYLAWHPRPKVPGDLQEHNFFRQRFVAHRWSFEKRGRAIEVYPSRRQMPAALQAFIDALKAQTRS
jgi:hypothetical protein